MLWPVSAAAAITAVRSPILSASAGTTSLWRSERIDPTRGYPFVRVNCPTSEMPRRKKSEHPVR